MGGSENRWPCWMPVSALEEDRCCLPPPAAAKQGRGLLSAQPEAGTSGGRHQKPVGLGKECQLKVEVSLAVPPPLSFADGYFGRDQVVAERWLFHSSWVSSRRSVPAAWASSDRSHPVAVKETAGVT